MAYEFLLVGDPKQLWRGKLKAAVAPLGKLRALTEQQAAAQFFEVECDVVVVDATAVEHPEELVSRFSSQLEPPYIIVMSADPTAEEALEVFRAGATDCVEKFNTKEELETYFTDLLANSTAARSAVG